MVTKKTSDPRQRGSLANKLRSHPSLAKPTKRDSGILLAGAVIPSENFYVVMVMVVMEVVVVLSILVLLVNWKCKRVYYFVSTARVRAL